VSKNSTSRFGAYTCKLVWLILFCSSTILGCGHNQVVRQLQSENDRLLAEFRAEREQKLQLSEKLAATQARLAESEKLVARQNPLPANRVSRVGPADQTYNGGQALSSGPVGLKRPLPTAETPSDLQWRPMSRAAR
jgi:hypothetical protein